MDSAQWLPILQKLLIATVLGGFLGAERQIHHHAAGLRTHMMVAMGTAMFVMAGAEISQTSPTDLSRVVQGVATGIGFLGAGTILKLTDKMEVRGLTTASSIWLAAAVGTASGLGLYRLAVAGTVISVIVLAVLHPLESLFGPKDKAQS